MPSFRPSSRIRLQLRIDERTDTAELESKLDRDAPDGATVMDTIPTTELGRQEELNVNRARKRALQRERAGLSPDELASRTVRLDERRNSLQLGGASEQNKPQGISPTTDQDGRTIGIDVVPLTAAIQRNGLMEADTAEVTFDYRTVPIDPRVIRACFLDLVIGTVSASDFEFGVLGVTRDDGSPLSLVARTPGQDVQLGSSTRFVGYIDDWNLSADDGDTITIRARDMTAPLIDQKLPTGVTIDLQQPIADGIQELVDTFASTRGMKVIFGNPGEDELVPFGRGDRGPVPSDSIPRSRKARRGQQARRAKSGDTAMSVWDHIVDTVVATGFLPIIRGLALYLIEPRTFYQRTSNSKKLVYGRNLKKLEYARKIGGVSKVPTIEVRCPDPTIGRTRWARAPVMKGQQASGVFGINDPPKATRANNVSPGGSAQEEIKVIPISGISDGEALERIATSLYEQIGRQEIEGNFSTDDITAFESEDEGDLLNLQPGDPVEILIAPLNAASTEDSTNTTPGGSVSSLQEITSFTVSRRREFLVSLGYAELAAQRLAEAQEQTHLVTTFRVQDVSIDWSQDEGVSIEGDFVNFIVVRESPEAAAQSASAEVLAVTAGSTSLAAQATEAASAAGNTAGAQRQRGEISNTEYEETSTEERGRQQRANQARRRGG